MEMELDNRDMKYLSIIFITKLSWLVLLSLDFESNKISDLGA